MLCQGISPLLRPDSGRTDKILASGFSRLFPMKEKGGLTIVQGKNLLPYFAALKLISYHILQGLPPMVSVDHHDFMHVAAASVQDVYKRQASYWLVLQYLS